MAVTCTQSWLRPRSTPPDDGDRDDVLKAGEQFPAMIAAKSGLVKLL